jgi:hypothetical protein
MPQPRPNLSAVPEAADDDVDPRQYAQDELGAAMVPTPDDVLADVGPLGQLYYLEQLAWTVFKNWTAFLASDSESSPDAKDERVEALEAIGLATGNTDQACIILGILPPEAAGSSV